MSRTSPATATLPRVVLCGEHHAPFLEEASIEYLPADPVEYKDECKAMFDGVAEVLVSTLFPPCTQSSHPYIHSKSIPP